MRKTTTWRPDTCDCVIHYQWDTEDSQETRTHTPVSGVIDSTGTYRPTVRCEAHRDKVDIGEHFQAVSSENTNVNAVRNVIIDQFPDLVTVDEKGNKLVSDKVSMTFDANRNLIVAAPGLSDSEKTSLETAISAKANIGGLLT